MPQRAVFFLGYHLQVRNGGMQCRIPVYQAITTVNEALFIQIDEYFLDYFGELIVHGETLATPVGR